MEQYMDYKQLLFFKKAAELQHMTKAAEELNVSQPYLSSTIASLESSLGVDLFAHVGRGIELNEYGEVLYKHVINIFNEAQDAYKELNEMAGKADYTLSIGTNCGMYMPGLLKYIQDRFPNLAANLLSTRQFKLRKLLSEGRIDFAISLSSEIFDDFECAILLHEKAGIIHGEDHWLKDRDAIFLKEIEQEPFVKVPEGYAISDAMAEYFHKHHFSPPTTIITSDTSSAFNYVKAGLGLAAAPLSIVLSDPYFRTNYVTISDFQAEGEIALYWRKGQHLNRTSKDFIALAKYYFQMQESFLS